MRVRNDGMSVARGEEGERRKNEEGQRRKEMSEERRAHEKGRRHEKEESNFKINKIKQTTLKACIEEKQLT